MEFVAGWILVQVVFFLGVLWVSWRYFDHRYKRRKQGRAEPGLLSGSLVRTAEVFVDPKDGLTYRVYYNPSTGEREYVQE
ncbi:hypothetical protein [Paenibacillus turpanensis]|uniref:hypothetical protein n=1 Tax=Paenibacillus turpanensis TaxID=2689078 RepID=UPI00140C3616|nr:hypothetical protein [Paenibacillus turpanensis]